jgi:hypothetical protein
MLCSVEERGWLRRETQLNRQLQPPRIREPRRERLVLAPQAPPKMSYQVLSSSGLQSRESLGHIYIRRRNRTPPSAVPWVGGRAYCIHDTFLR